MTDFNEIANQLDDIINSDTALVTVDMIELMRKAKKAVQKLTPEIKRAKNAGLSVDIALERISNMENKIDTFLREYDR